MGRPKCTVAYHVKVLEEAGLVRVVRTRRVRAIEERYSVELRGCSTSMVDGGLRAKCCRRAVGIFFAGSFVLVAYIEDDW